MKFDLSSIKKTEGGSNVSPYITAGRGQELKINQIELSKSQNTGNSKAVLHVETKPIKEDGFVPADGHKGKIGKVACGVYLKTDEQKTEFLANMKAIAESMDLSDEIEEIGGETFEEVIDKIQTLFSSSKKFARFTVYAEEYPKQNSKTGIKLFLPRYNFVENLNVAIEQSKLAPYDETNVKHFKKLPASGDTVRAAAVNLSGADDLPF